MYTHILWKLCKWQYYYNMAKKRWYVDGKHERAQYNIIHEKEEHIHPSHTPSFIIFGPNQCS